MPYEQSFPQQSEKSEDFFARQFAKREKISLAGGMAEIVDISPEQVKTEVPVFFAPAWACTMKVYREAFRELSQAGRRVISLDHPRWGDTLDTESIPPDVLEKYPREELRKALNILGVLREKGIEQTDAIAHSEGAVNLVLAALLEPERFRNMILYAPAGLIGKDSFVRLLKGFSGQAKRGETLGAIPVSDLERSQAEERGNSIPPYEEIPLTEKAKQVGATAAKEALQYLLKNPVRGIKEGIGISESQIHDVLRYLHEEKGIGIVIMSGVDDPVFPMERIQETVNTHMVDGVLSLRGGHGQIGENPEQYMVAAEKMLTALEEKKSKAGQA